MSSLALAPIAPVAPIVRVVTADDLDARQDRLILNADALRDTCMEEMTPATLAQIDQLFSQFGADLAAIRAAVLVQGIKAS